MTFSRAGFKNGLTLVEMLVAAGVFSVIIVISIGAMVVANDAFRKTSLQRAATENLNVALETMARNIRTGSEYVSVSSSEFSFLSSGGERTVYKLNAPQKQVEVSKDGGIFQPITSTELEVENLTFRLTGDNNTQPRVTITIGGSTQIPGKSELDTAFNIQTTVSQRSFACAAQPIGINFASGLGTASLSDGGSADFTLPQCWNLQSLTVDVDASGVELGGGDAAIVFLTDLSGSMVFTSNNLSDGTTRLAAAQAALSDALNLLSVAAPSAKVALATFSGGSNPLFPPLILTNTTECLGGFCDAGVDVDNDYLPRIVSSYTGIVGGQTPTAEGIALAESLIQSRSEPQKVIIVLSDGEANQPYVDSEFGSIIDPLPIFQRLRGEGVTIFTISFVNPAYISAEVIRDNTLITAACLTRRMALWSSEPTENSSCPTPYYSFGCSDGSLDLLSWPLCGDSAKQFGYSWYIDGVRNGQDLTSIYRRIIQSLPLSGTVSLNTSAEPTPLQGVVSEDLPLDISGIACEPGAVQDLSLLLNLNGLLGNATLRNLTANLCQVN